MARLTFANDALRHVILAIAVSDDPSKWLGQFNDIERALQEKYGAQRTTEVHKPSDCEGETVACLKDGRAFRMNTWISGDAWLRIRLGRVANNASLPLLFVEYSAPERMSRRSKTDAL